MNTLGSLFGGQDIDKTSREKPELVRLGNMPVERSRIVLSEDEDLIDSGVDTVANGNVDQPILAAEGNGGLGANQCQREKASSLAASQDQSKNVFHRPIVAWPHRDNLVRTVSTALTNKNFESSGMLEWLHLER